ncbi:uncharacterized protein G2W53_030724 [Senna tora]|uniref:Uncharacterized protein n=1 Tax=Senna tora TaxID=362788 RepID=A0A834WB30_9FABA|nr:uncharacterized protein G2W53_030724 [Senna tora]
MHVTLKVHATSNKGMRNYFDIDNWLYDQPMLSSLEKAWKLKVPFTIKMVISTGLLQVKKRNYLSSPLAFQTSILGDLAFPAVHQGLQTVDLLRIVDVDLERKLRAIPSLRPRLGSTEHLVLGCAHLINGEAAWSEGVVEESSEEEGGNDEE